MIGGERRGEMEGSKKEIRVASRKGSCGPRRSSTWACRTPSVRAW